MSNLIVTDEGERSAVRAWLNIQRSANTRRAYERIAIAYITAYSLREAGIEQLVIWQQGLRGSSSSVALSTAAIKSLYSFLYRAGAIPINPATLLKVPRVRSNLAERILSVDEVRAILKEARNGKNGVRNHSLFALMFYSGLRISEVESLNWSDLRGGVLNVWGKGEKERNVTLPESLAEELERLRGDGSMFGIERSVIHKTIKGIIKRAGLGVKISCHWLRHANASIALDGGASIKCIQETLGHSSINTTARYLHVKPGESSGNFLPKL